MSVYYLIYCFYLLGEILWIKNYGLLVVGIYKMDNEVLLKVKVNYIVKEIFIYFIGVNTFSFLYENIFFGDGGEIVL